MKNPQPQLQLYIWRDASITEQPGSAAFALAYSLEDARQALRNRIADHLAVDDWQDSEIDGFFEDTVKFLEREPEVFNEPSSFLVYLSS